MTEIDRLLDLLDQAFDHKAWHGTNLKGSVRGLNAGKAAWRPAPGRHSIAEIVVHAAYWKYAVNRRLTGTRRGSFPIPGSNWFAVSDDLDEKTWQGHVRLLVSTHRTLREAVAALDPDRLDRHEAGSRFRVLDLVHGAASHDLYHAGQVQLLKALQRSSGVGAP